MFYLALAKIFNAGIFSDKNIFYMLLSLLGQIFIGHTFNATMWFQIDLILITILFYIVYSKFDDERATKIIIFLCIFGFFMQYSKLNLKLFGNLNGYFRWTPGRFCEMLPIASAGLLFVKFDVINKLSRHKNFILLILIAFMPLIFKLRRFTPVGFQYSGIFLFSVAIVMSIIFCFLPFDKFPDYIKISIKNISRFTPGIYYMHRLTANFIIFKKGSFINCAIIFMTCLIIGFLISKISNKLSKFLVE